MVIPLISGEIRPQEEMLEIKADDMFKYYHHHFQHLCLGKAPEEIAVYVQPAEPRIIFSPEDLRIPYKSKVIIGPKEGSLLTEYIPGKSESATLKRIQPDPELPGVVHYWHSLDYHIDDPVQLLTEQRIITIHTNSRTLPQGLAYTFFKF
jgi:hypothetical protein